MFAGTRLALGSACFCSQKIMQTPRAELSSIHGSLLCERTRLPADLPRGRAEDLRVEVGSVIVDSWQIPRVVYDNSVAGRRETRSRGRHQTAARRSLECNQSPARLRAVGGSYAFGIVRRWVPSKNHMNVCDVALA